MNKYKLRLIGILLIQLIITVMHNASSNEVDASNFYQLDNWTYWLAMGWGIWAIVYVITSKQGQSKINLQRLGVQG
jgi:hypothetical protein